ncbi:MAG: hypothetical protein ACREA0_35265 [bacterium]
MTPRSWEDMKKDPAVHAVVFGLLVASLDKKPYDLEFILRMADECKRHALPAAQEAQS